MIKKLFERLEQPSFKNIALIIKLFRYAAKQDQDDQEGSKIDKYFTDSQDYGNLLQYCFLKLPEQIKSFYKVDYVDNLTKEDIKSHVQLIIIRGFLIQSMKFLENTITNQEQDEPALLYSIQALGNLNQVCSAFDSIQKKLISLLIQVWGFGSLKVKLQAFIQVRRIFQQLKDHQQTLIIKKFYVAYTSQAKHLMWRNYECVNLMINCIVELLNMNMNQGYQIAYQSLQILVKQIRDASQSKNEENVRNIYNQQTINILRLWTKAVCKHKEINQLGDLMPAIVQLILAVLDFYPSVEHYPFQLHLIQLLIQITETFKVWINIIPYILRMLSCAELKRSKLKTSVRPYDFDIGYNIKPKHRQSRQFWDEMCQQLINNLIVYLSYFIKSKVFKESIIFLDKQLKDISLTFGFSGNKIRVQKLRKMLKEEYSGKETQLETEAQRIIFDHQEIIKQKILSQNEEEELSEVEQDIQDEKDQEYVFEEIKKYKDEHKKDDDDDLDSDVLNEYEGDPEL
ncbi:Nucleolar complex protein 2 [Paramecium bursaria]